MSNWAVELFGEAVLTKEGGKDTAAVIACKKLVGIYFGAQICPPCREFSPILAEFYDQLKEEAGHEDSLEIIFVSSDCNQSSFDEYYGSMPWSAVPYRSAKANLLAQKYGVRGIPTFIVLDSHGNTVDREGRITVATASGNTRVVLKKWSR
eukprot:gene9455-10267_t